jgi:hypothetical protein
MAVSSKVVTAGIAALVAVGAVGIIIQQNQLQAANASLAASNAQMQQTQAQLEASKADLAASNAQMQREVVAASMPELPVLVGFRPALLGRGKVARIENASGQDMAVRARVVDAASHQVREFTLNIDRGQIAEFGHAQGYAFEPGDEVTLSHDGYKAKTWTVR